MDPRPPTDEAIQQMRAHVTQAFVDGDHLLEAIEEALTIGRLAGLRGAAG